MTTFFSVDVEATSTNSHTGLLLTVGIQPVRWTPGQTATVTTEALYVRINHHSRLSRLGWYSGAASGDATYDWWMTQPDDVHGEAFSDHTLTRLDPNVAATTIHTFCTGLEADHTERVFVANPVSYDKPWLDELLSAARHHNTFHYRSLCLRSMRFGLTPHSGWGTDRAGDTHRPLIAHHAYWDAHAQALDLCDMLTARDQHPHTPTP